MMNIWPYNRGCKVCGKREDIKRCTGCKKVFYCSKFCQSFDRKEHKDFCVDDGNAVEKTEKKDPQDPCPICMEEECDEGMFLICVQCGYRFCNMCCMPKNHGSLKCCPGCRDNTTRTNEEYIQCFKKLLKRGVKKKYIYPFLADYEYMVYPKDPRHFNLLMEAIDDGSCYASYKLACMLDTKENDDLVINCYLESASGRINEAQHWLGNYFTRKGNKEYADHWHLRAAQNGNIKSMKYTADNGNIKYSEEWFLRAGENGCHESMFRYADIRQGQGDIDNAYKWYMLSAPKYSESYYRLGKMYEGETSVMFYHIGSESNNVNCLLELGNLYFEYMLTESESIGPDYEKKFLDKGIEYLKRASELGSGKASKKLGDYYLHIKDFKLAIQFYSEGFQKGEISSYFSLGDIYLKGLGVLKDTPKAIYYLGIASENGCELSSKILKELFIKNNLYI